MTESELSAMQALCDANKKYNIGYHTKAASYSDVEKLIAEVRRLNKHLELEVAVNDNYQGVVQRMDEAEDEVIRLRFCADKRGAKLTDYVRENVDLVLERDRLRAENEALKAKQHDCSIAEKLSNDAYERCNELGAENEALKAKLTSARHALEELLQAEEVKP